MMQRESTTEHSLRYLVIRALLVIAVVVGGLVTLRCLEITVTERDVPAPVVEEITRESPPAET